MSFQEVSLLIDQEHEIFYSLSNFIFLWVIIRIIKMYKGKCLQLLFLLRSFKLFNKLYTINPSLLKLLDLYTFYTYYISTFYNPI